MTNLQKRKKNFYLDPATKVSMKKYLLLTIIATLISNLTIAQVIDNENELHAKYKVKKPIVIPMKDYSESPVFVNINITDQAAPQNEPSVRISRVNSDIVVAAWRDFRLGWQEPNVIRRIGYSYSHDGGQTWSVAQLLPDPNPNHLSQSDPVVTSDALGNFYISSTSRQPVTSYNRDMLLYRSIDNGQTFELYATAVPGSGLQGEDKEWIFNDPVTSNPTYDNIFIVWRSFGPSYGIKFRKSQDNGATWSSTVNVSNNQSGQGANVASGTNGDIYVTWLDNGIFFDVSSDGGNSFGQDKMLENITYNKNYSFPFICVDYSQNPSRGNIYIVWSDYNSGDEDILFQRSTDGGVSWLPDPIIVNDVLTNDQYWPAIQCDNDGNIAVVFYDERTQQGLMNAYLAYSENQGNTWTNIKLSESPFLGSEPNSNVRFGDYIDIDSYDGKIIPVWTDDRTFNYNQEIYTAVVDINTGILNPILLSKNYKLEQNYPNPFRNKTNIPFVLDESGYVRIDIFNTLGENIETLVNENLFEGKHHYSWNASHYPEGVYFYEMIFKDKAITKEMIHIQ